jgi:hypothetical protein
MDTLHKGDNVVVDDDNNNNNNNNVKVQTFSCHRTKQCRKGSATCRYVATVSSALLRAVWL